MHDWVLGTGAHWVSMGVPSDGSYGIPLDTMFGFPVTCAQGDYKIVPGLSIDEFSRERLDRTLAELDDERKAVVDLMK
jgi:malate dehydrogenase